MYQKVNGFVILKREEIGILKIGYYSSIQKRFFSRLPLKLLNRLPLMLLAVEFSNKRAPKFKLLTDSFVTRRRVKSVNKSVLQDRRRWTVRPSARRQIPPHRKGLLDIHAADLRGNGLHPRTQHHSPRPESKRSTVYLSAAQCELTHLFAFQPENILCLTESGNRIKIIDFGLAREYDPSTKLQVLFGTPEFVAPEVVNFEAITFATDMWSVGVIAYVLWVNQFIDSEITGSALKADSIKREIFAARRECKYLIETNFVFSFPSLSIIAACLACRRSLANATWRRWATWRSANMTSTMKLSTKCLKSALISFRSCWWRSMASDWQHTKH